MFAKALSAQARGLQLVAERERARTSAAEAEVHRMQALQSTYQGLQDPQVQAMPRIAVIAHVERAALQSRVGGPKA